MRSAPFPPFAQRPVRLACHPGDCHSAVSQDLTRPHLLDEIETQGSYTEWL